MHLRASVIDSPVVRPNEINLHLSTLDFAWRDISPAGLMRKMLSIPLTVLGSFLIDNDWVSGWPHFAERALRTPGISIECGSGRGVSSIEKWDRAAGAVAITDLPM